jgi:hypothetical protein
VDGVHRPTVKPTDHRDSQLLDRQWLNRHLDNVDVVHLHGLPPRLTPAEVAATVDAVRASGTPLVVTGYHLSDPAGRRGTSYGQQLDELVPKADAVVTLTLPAAEEMRRRWDVDPIVLPHPHAVDFVRMRQERQCRGQFLIGMHLAGLNLLADPVRLTSALARAVLRLRQQHPHARLAVHLHQTVLDPGAAGYNPHLVRQLDDTLRGCEGILRVHRPFTEPQLWDHLFSLDLSVVPRLYGSHSIWPEACADLGTQALLPAGSHACAQQPCLVYATGSEPDGGIDVETTTQSLLAALTTAADQGCVWRADPEERWAERVKTAESLRSLYERLLGVV